MLRTKVTSCLKPACSPAAFAVISTEEHMASLQGSYPREAKSMTERDHRTGSGGVKDNVRDELAEAAGSPRKEAAPEEEEQAGSGGVKDTAQDELAESQDRR
jgi:hypothetical protein